MPGGVGGFCDARAKPIVVDSAAPANSRVRTLVHEIAHALGVDYRDYSRAQAEVIVDSVIFSSGWLESSMAAGLQVGDGLLPRHFGIRDSTRMFGTSSRVRAVIGIAPEDLLTRRRTCGGCLGWVSQPQRSCDGAVAEPQGQPQPYAFSTEQTSGKTCPQRSALALRAAQVIRQARTRQCRQA